MDYLCGRTTRGHCCAVYGPAYGRYSLYGQRAGAAHITRPLSRLWTIYADGRPADIVAPFTARRTAAIAYTANAQGRLSELEPDCS